MIGRALPEKSRNLEKLHSLAKREDWLAEGEQPGSNILLAGHRGLSWPSELERIGGGSSLDRTSLRLKFRVNTENIRELRTSD